MNIELQKIGVATDFSKAADVALKYGWTMARQFGAELHLIHVIEDIIPTVPEPGLAMLPTQEIMQTLRRSSEAAMNEQLARIPGGEVPFVKVVREGVPFREVDNYAREVAIDLLVLGTHGRTGLSHLLLGSVAERVLRSAPCPVLTVHAHERDFIK
ncbi:universal stress protein [bacterium]|nr:universal stress protein [bacterium]